MGYTLEAIVGSTNAMHVLVDSHPAAVPVALRHGIVLVPMTDDLFDALADGTEGRPLGFWKLPGGFDRELSSWSSAGSLGYVEAEYFGGVGTQRAALWAAGGLVLGPLFTDDGEGFAAGGSPISQVLARLGVERDGHRDEFDAVGLGRHRETEDWLP